MYMRPCVSTRRLGSKPQPFSTVTGRPKLGGVLAACAGLLANAEPATNMPAAASSSARRSAAELRDPVGVTFLSSPLAANFVASYNGGGHCLLVGGHLVLTGKHSDILLAELPPIVHIRENSDKAAMRWCVERMNEELRNPQPGGFLVAQQLGYMILVQGLRLHLAEGLKGRAGWLFALSDKEISAAIASIHDEPAHDWTVDSR